MMQRSVISMMIRCSAGRSRWKTTRLICRRAVVAPTAHHVEAMQQCSSLHSTASPLQSSNSSSSSDTRLAGRIRFYKSVGVIPVKAPWEESSSFPESMNMDSPISAGVDGTQSASGISSSIVSSKHHFKESLTPRQPNSDKTASPINWFGVTLDGRSIKTPLGQTLAVPSQTLAWAIAAEWDAQQKYLQPAQMPLMTLACTALDQTTAVPPIDGVLRYLSTDTVCYWADPAQDRVLYRKQLECSWEGLHDYSTTLLGDRPASAMGASEGLLMSRARPNKAGGGGAGLPHSPQLVQAARDWVDSLDAWNLTCLYSIAAQAKSFLIAMALIESSYPSSASSNGEKNPFHDDVNKAVLASRVEEEFQIDNWGLVEGGHDYDRLNCSVQIHAAHFFVSSIANEYFITDDENRPKIV